MLHVTVRQLRVFVTVARQLSFARAAEELHLTPPAISMQIKQLETLLGLPLLDRGSGEVRLTLAGEYFLAHARKLMATLKDAEDLVAKLRRVETGRLNIGMLGTAKYFLPYLLAGFQREHPGIDIQLTEGNRQHLVGSLQGNEIDLAIMGRPPRELDTRAEAFGAHPLGVVAAASHPLVRREGITPDQLAGEPFISRESGSGTRLTMEACFRDWKISPPIVMRMSSNETIKQAVMAGMGLSFLSLHTIDAELREQRLRWLPVEGMPLMRQWHVVHLRARVLSPAAEAFRYHVIESGQSFLRNHFRAAPAGAISRKP